MFQNQAVELRLKPRYSDAKVQALNQTVEAIKGKLRVYIFWCPNRCSKAPPPKVFLPLHCSEPPSITSLARDHVASVSIVPDMGPCWLRRQPLAWLKWTKHSLVLGIYKSSPSIRFMATQYSFTPGPRVEEIPEFFSDGVGLWCHDFNHSI